MYYKITSRLLFRRKNGPIDTFERGIEIETGSQETEVGSKNTMEKLDGADSAEFHSSPLTPGGGGERFIDLSIECHGIRAMSF